MKLGEIREYFLSRAPWVEREKTHDIIFVGDAEREIDRCLVTWMPGYRELRIAVEGGFPLLICHESMYWYTRAHSPEEGDFVDAKLGFAAQNGLAVWRNHDCWDRWPEAGIPWAWGRHLGFTAAPVQICPRNYQHRYDIEPVRLDEFARRVAGRCAAFGEPVVQVIGDGDRLVSRIGIGTGCLCDVRVNRAMGCDCSIVCDDGSRYWGEIQNAIDTGHPIIRVGHGTAEEAGMRSLTDYVNRELPGLRAELLPHPSPYRLVGV